MTAQPQTHTPGDGSPFLMVLRGGDGAHHVHIEHSPGECSDYRDVLGNPLTVVSTVLLSEAMAAPDLLAACKAVVAACRCEGTGKYEGDCRLCGDSTFDHDCVYPTYCCTNAGCVAARSALAKAGVA